MIVEIAVRTTIIFVWVLVLLRVAGKRSLGQMNVYDLAMLMAVANGIQNAITKGSGDLAVGLTSSCTLLLLGWIFSRLAARNAGIHDVLLGTATVLASNGHLERSLLRRENISQDDIHRALRSVGLTQVAQARMIVLEVDGTLSVVPRESTPPTGRANHADSADLSGDGPSR